MEGPEEFTERTTKNWTPFRVKNDVSQVGLDDESEH
jgi:hypothetical protein